MIIPCFNVEAHIAACLEAVYAQTHQDLEIICVDDGSEDGTVFTINNAPKGPFPLKLIESDNKGACAARNQGLQHSQGDYIQFLDADDILHSTKISEQLALIEEATVLPEVIIGDYINVYPNGREEAVESSKGRDWMALVKTQLGTTSANLWQRNAVERVGAWSNRLSSSQDYELLFRLLKDGASFVHDGMPLTRVLKRETGSISQTGKFDNWKRYIDLRVEMRNHLSVAGESYIEEIGVIDQYLFMAIRVLSQYDMKFAQAAFDELIPKDFLPIGSKAISKQYISLYSIFGFGFSEKFIRFFKPQLYRRE